MKLLPYPPYLKDLAATSRQQANREHEDVSRLAKRYGATVTGPHTDPMGHSYSLVTLAAKYPSQNQMMYEMASALHQRLAAGGRRAIQVQRQADNLGSVRHTLTVLHSGPIPA